MNGSDVHSDNNSNVGFPFPKQDSHRKKLTESVGNLQWIISYIECLKWELKYISSGGISLRT